MLEHSTLPSELSEQQRTANFMSLGCSSISTFPANAGHPSAVQCASTFGDGAPTLLSVWLPLNAVSVDNGCMMVVPRQLDPHFHKRFNYAHMRPALPPDKDDVDGATEVRHQA